MITSKTIKCNKRVVEPNRRICMIKSDEFNPLKKIGDQLDVRHRGVLLTYLLTY